MFTIVFVLIGVPDKPCTEHIHHITSQVAALADAALGLVGKTENELSAPVQPPRPQSLSYHRGERLGAVR